MFLRYALGFLSAAVIGGLVFLLQPSVQRDALLGNVGNVGGAYCHFDEDCDLGCCNNMECGECSGSSSSSSSCFVDMQCPGIATETEYPCCAEDPDSGIYACQMCTVPPLCKTNDFECSSDIECCSGACTDGLCSPIFPVGYCGDGTQDVGEECDPMVMTDSSEMTDSSTCDYVDGFDLLNACTDRVCGDGYTNQAGGETCDDGNVVSGDGCDIECHVETCSACAGLDETACGMAYGCDYRGQSLLNRLTGGWFGQGAACVSTDSCGGGTDGDTGGDGGGGESSSSAPTLGTCCTVRGNADRTQSVWCDMEPSEAVCESDATHYWRPDIDSCDAEDWETQCALPDLEVHYGGDILLNDILLSPVGRARVSVRNRGQRAASNIVLTINIPSPFSYGGGNPLSVSGGGSCETTANQITCQFSSISTDENVEVVFSVQRLAICLPIPASADAFVTTTDDEIMTANNTDSATYRSNCGVCCPSEISLNTRACQATDYMNKDDCNLFYPQSTWLPPPNTCAQCPGRSSASSSSPSSAAPKQACCLYDRQKVVNGELTPPWTNPRCEMRAIPTVGTLCPDTENTTSNSGEWSETRPLIPESNCLHFGPEVCKKGEVDLVLTKTLNLSAVPLTVSRKVGDTVTFTLVVTNNGTAQATNVTVMDFVPPNLTYVPATGSTCSVSVNSALLTCPLGTIAPGSLAARTVTLTFTVTTMPPTCASVINRASVSSNTVDSNPSDNSASASFNLKCDAPTSVTCCTSENTCVPIQGSACTNSMPETQGKLKTCPTAGSNAEKAACPPTEVNTCCLHNSDKNRTAAKEVADKPKCVGIRTYKFPVEIGTVEDPVTDHKYVPQAQTVAECAEYFKEVSCCESSKQCTPKVRKYLCEERGGTPTNSCSTTCALPASSSSSRASVKDISITKSVSPVPNPTTPLKAGDTLTYAITVTNHGDQQATGVQVSEPFPPGLTILFMPAECTNTGLGWIRCQNLTIDAGASWSRSFTFQIQEPPPSCISRFPISPNTASVTAPPKFDEKSNNNYATAPGFEVACGTWSVTKKLKTFGTFAAGQNVTFELEFLRLYNDYNGPQITGDKDYFIDTLINMKINPAETPAGCSVDNTLPTGARLKCDMRYPTEKNKKYTVSITAVIDPNICFDQTPTITNSVTVVRGRGVTPSTDTFLAQNSVSSDVACNDAIKYCCGTGAKSEQCVQKMTDSDCADPTKTYQAIPFNCKDECTPPASEHCCTTEATPRCVKAVKNVTCKEGKKYKTNDCDKKCENPPPPAPKEGFYCSDIKCMACKDAECVGRKLMPECKDNKEACKPAEVKEACCISGKCEDLPEGECIPSSGTPHVGKKCSDATVICKIEPPKKPSCWTCNIASTCVPQTDGQCHHTSESKCIEAQGNKGMCSDKFGSCCWKAKDDEKKELRVCQPMGKKRCQSAAKQKYTITVGDKEYPVTSSTFYTQPSCNKLCEPPKETESEKGCCLGNLEDESVRSCSTTITSQGDCERLKNGALKAEWLGASCPTLCTNTVASCPSDCKPSTLVAGMKTCPNPTVQASTSWWGRLVARVMGTTEVAVIRPNADGCCCPSKIVPPSKPVVGPSSCKECEKVLDKKTCETPTDIGLDIRLSFCEWDNPIFGLFGGGSCKKKPLVCLDTTGGTNGTTGGITGTTGGTGGVSGGDTGGTTGGTDGGTAGTTGATGGTGGGARSAGSVKASSSSSVRRIITVRGILFPKQCGNRMIEPEHHEECEPGLVTPFGRTCSSTCVLEPCVAGTMPEVDGSCTPAPSCPTDTSLSANPTQLVLHCLSLCARLPNAAVCHAACVCRCRPGASNTAVGDAVQSTRVCISRGEQGARCSALSIGQFCRAQ